VINSIVWI